MWYEVLGSFFFWLPRDEILKLYWQELMNDNPGVTAFLDANQCQWLTSYLIRTCYSKAADPCSQLQHKNLQQQISGGSTYTHPQGMLAWTCSYMQESFVSATESHHSPLSPQWHNAHEEYFPLTDVGPETSIPCVCSVNPLVHCQEEYFCQQISNQLILKLLIKINLESSSHNN